MDANADSYAQKSNNGYAHVTNLDLNLVHEAILKRLGSSAASY